MAQSTNISEQFIHFLPDSNVKSIHDNSTPQNFITSSGCKAKDKQPIEFLFNKRLEKFTFFL